MKQRMFWILPIVLAASMSSLPAQANGVDFTSASGGGTISFDGSPTGILTGSGIPITSTAFTGEAGYDVTGYSCGDSGFACGLLAFETGQVVSASDSEVTFGGGGWLTLTGMVPGGSGVVTLLSAVFADDVTVTQLATTTILLSGNIMALEVDASLAALFPQLANVPRSGSFISFVIDAQLGVTGAFVGTATSQDIFIYTPEPTSMILLGTGLLGGAGLLRRRRRAKS